MTNVHPFPERHPSPDFSGTSMDLLFRWLEAAEKEDQPPIIAEIRRRWLAKLAGEKALIAEVRNVLEEGAAELVKARELLS